MTDDMNRQDETMIYGLSVAERDVLQKKLQELADTMPPRAVWQRIETQAKAQGLFARKGIGESLKWISGAAIAATVALAVLRFPLGPEIDLENDTFPTEPVYQESVANSSGNGGLRAVRALMVQSRQLESDLRALPDQPQLARAGTLAAIMDLEDRIAAIDNILNDPASQLTPEQSETYWRERVRLMSSLLQLRYAQAQRMSF